MKCVTPSLIYTAQGPMRVPCNRCMACRINKGQEWTLRLLYELEKKEGFFVTLTFDEEHYPSDGSLNKKVMQDFNKRVRKHFAGSVKSDYKYYLCGEYGPATLRPHYHLAMLGVDLNPPEWIFVKMQDGHPIYTSPTLSRLWPFGFNSIDYLNKTTINYVTGYIQKKLMGSSARFYKDLHLVPPFQLFSRGLGLDFLQEHKNQILDNGFVSFYGSKMPIPGYYADKIGLSDLTTDDGVNLRSQLAYDAQDEAMEEWMHKTGGSEFDYAEYVISARLQKKIDMDAKEDIMRSRSKL